MRKSHYLLTDPRNIFITGKNIQSVYSKTNLELKNIDEWMTANKLTVNSAKTKYLLFTPRKSNCSISNTSFEVYFRNNTIEKVSSIRFLGVIINENLSWKEHMNMIKQKIRSSLGSIMRVKPCLTTKAMLILYNLLLLSHLRYCITNWCFGNRIKINQLQRICNKFIRAMYGIKRRGCVKNVMIKNELLNIQQLYESKIAILMYKFQKRTLPIPIQQLFQLKPCQIKTRSDSQIISSCFRTAICQQSIKFIGPKIWNTLPQEIQNFQKQTKNLLSNWRNIRRIYVNIVPYLQHRKLKKKKIFFFCLLLFSFYISGHRRHQFKNSTLHAPGTIA